MSRSEKESAIAAGAGTNDWLAGGGEMGKLIREKDWSQTPLGPLESWPQSLRTTVSLCVASNFPISIAWGPNRIQIYNDGYWPICGAKHPQSMGQDFKECWYSAWPVIGEAFERASKGETCFLVNQRMFLDRLGYLEETFFTFSFSPIRDESGGVGGLFHPVTELTQQSLAERRLRVLRDIADRTSQAQSLDEALSLIADGLSLAQLDVPFALIYRVSADGTDATLARSVGMTPGEPLAPETIKLDGAMTSWPFLEALHSRALEVPDLVQRYGSFRAGPYEESPRAAVLLPLALPGVTAPFGVLIAGVSARRPLDEHYRTFFDMLGEVVSNALAKARAYEEERKRAEALAELDRAKTAFFSNVSHEFRTPLTLMLGPLEDALQSEALHAQDRERLAVVHRNGLRLLKLVNTLLDFSRIEAGRVQAVYEPTDLAGLTAELASVFRSAIERAGLQLVVHCPPLPGPVYVDREMWEKIVLNLLSNAFKFTFEGEITVAVVANETHVTLSVQDTGTGITPEELPRVFERFHRIQGARSRTYEGTGIGLALVQELVRLHGGTVTVESEYGKGTTFAVSIPFGSEHLPQDRLGASRTLASTATGAAPFVEEALRWLPDEQSAAGDLFESAPRLEVGDTAVKRPRILLADDNADMREYVRRLLSQRYEVDAVADGRTALARARQYPPDLVLTDVMMPNLDGFGLLRELRTDSRTRGIPIILLSARAGEESRVEGLQAGADDYLIKPFSARELITRVNTHLEMARLRTEWSSREQEALRRSEEAQAQLERVLESLSDGFLVLDREWRYAYVNRQGAAMGHRRPEELIGKKIWEEFPDAVGSLAYQELHRAAREQVVVHFEMFYAPLDAWFECHGYPSPDGLSVFVRDVTARKETEHQIKKLNEELTRKVGEYERLMRELEESKADLQERNMDLEKFHDLVVDRELRMIELEKELSELKGQGKGA